MLSDWHLLIQVVKILAWLLRCRFIVMFPECHPVSSFADSDQPTERSQASRNIYTKQCGVPRSVDTSQVLGPPLCLLFYFRVYCLFFPSFSQGLLGLPLLLSQNVVSWLGQGTHAQFTQLNWLVKGQVVYLGASWPWPVGRSLVLGSRIPHSSTCFLGVPRTLLLETLKNVL